jgi:FAD/FMN-containing dehydrogenase
VTGVGIPDTIDFARLREALAGELLEPGVPGYEAARKPAMPRFWGIRPRAVVRAASDQDVARTLAFARASGLPVVPRGGGHCFAGRSSTEGIVLDLTPLREVRVAAGGPADTGTATIGAGARLAEVYDALDEHGLAPAASTPTFPTPACPTRPPPTTRATTPA